MTIVVAGYNYGKNPWREVDGGKNPLGVRKEGIFAIADSVITSHSSNGRSPLLSGFKKIKEVPVKLWKPYFIDRNFHSYNSVFMRFECFVAFAGSTLTAQHVIDLISNHLATLRIDYQRASYSSPPEYVVKKSCDHNNLISNGNGSLYDLEMFVPEVHYNGILTAEYIFDVVEHSINKALRSAQKFRLDEQSLREMYTEFILGVNCPATGSDHLVKYTMDKRINSEGVYEVYAVSSYVDEGDIAVIGMSNRFGEDAKEKAKETIKNGLSLKDEMTEFVKSAILEINGEGSFQIAMPMVIKNMVNNKITKEVLSG